MSSIKCEQLLDTALELFYRHGIHATGISQIIAEAGVSRMTLYKHFRSKEELVRAVLERHDVRLREWLAAAIERHARAPISGGLNIYADDLELELLQHPAVSDAAVIAVPSDQWGETPLAFAVVDPAAALAPDELLAWVNGRLGKAQRISAIEFIDELPRSSIGKILKRELRAPYWRDQQQ